MNNKNQPHEKPRRGEWPRFPEDDTKKVFQKLAEETELFLQQITLKVWFHSLEKTIRENTKTNTTLPCSVGESS